MRSAIFCILQIVFCVILSAQDTLRPRKANKFHFLSAGIAGGPNYGIGSISKNSAKRNELGKFAGGGGFKIEVDAIIKEKYGLGIGLDYGFNGLKNHALQDSIYAALKNKKINSGDIPDNPLLIMGRFFIGASYYFKFGERLMIQPKIEFGIGLIAYDYTAMIDYNDNATRMLATYDGNSVSVTTLVPELNFKYIFFRRNWLDLALNLGANYYYAKPAFSINENKGEFFEAFNTYQDRNFMTVKGSLSLINTHIGLTWLFKLRRRG
jgi:hypothetical protein